MILFAFACVVVLGAATATTRPNDGIVTTIDFSKLPNGSSLKGGTYLQDEWLASYGLLLSASGGLSNKPRLFDSLHPGTKKHGDPDLGSPNERCGGPGKGEGGEPDTAGANCEPLGNVLIIQEDNDRPDVPDDNVDGGVITFQFDKPLRVAAIGLLDVDYKSFLRIKTFKSPGKTSSSDIPIPMLGDNSAQTIKIDTDNVVQLDLNLRRSGAVTFISFYYDLARIGEMCRGGDSCETGYCFNAVIVQPDGTTTGICSCNPKTNGGCSDGRKCLWPTLPGSSPSCSLPAGTVCVDDSDCYTESCVDNTCAVCNELTHYPCYYRDELCVPDEDDPRGYSCLPIGTKDIGDKCLSGSDCKTGYCYNYGAPITPESPGKCRCNPHTHAGCSDGRKCLWPTLPGSSPSCSLPAGAVCVDDSDCYAESCVDNTCAVCNELTNYPCYYPEVEVCVPDEDAPRGYSCLPKGVEVGDSCRYDEDCETGKCWREYPPGSPGICVCVPVTNQGCATDFEEECTVHPGTFNEPPSCYVPVGSECIAHWHCLSDHCYNEACVCNPDTNYPCSETEACRFKDSEYSCESCVIPDPVEYCFREIPVTCDGCDYANECLASKAGYKPHRDCHHSNEFVRGPDKGHLYKAVEKRQIIWDEANEEASSLSSRSKCGGGLVAYLAKITSLEEDVFVHELGWALRAYDNYKSFWVGGFQNEDSKGFEEPGGGWEWVAHGGSISTPTHPIDGAYKNWGPKEPNDFRNQPTNLQHLPENHMTICRFDDKTGWNDEFPGGPVRGYIVEAEVDPTVRIHSCDSGVDNLNPRLPSPKECPPGQISNLISDCMGYNRDLAFLQCVTYIVNELAKANIITSEERDSIAKCI